jgi:intracellular septation protein
MQLLLEFFPLIAFLVTYKVWDIYVATGTLMATMVLSLGISWLRTRKVTPMLGISTALVLIFGTATLLLHDIRFIQWKPSIFLWLLAIAFFISGFVGQQPLAQRLLQSALGDAQVQRPDWMKLNYAWVAFGLIIGAVNLVVAYHASEATWVNVKVYGLPGSTFLFMISQLSWLHFRGKLQQ